MPLRPLGVEGADGVQIGGGAEELAIIGAVPGLHGFEKGLVATGHVDPRHLEEGPFATLGIAAAEDAIPSVDPLKTRVGRVPYRHILRFWPQAPRPSCAQDQPIFAIVIVPTLLPGGCARVKAC